MTIHLHEPWGVYDMFTACGVLRAALDPKQETKSKAKVTCKRCQKVIRARKPRKTSDE